MRTVMGERVLLSRRDLGMTQKELAKRVNVSQSYISQIERGGKVNVTTTVVEALAKALNVPVSYLLGETDEATHRDTDQIYEFWDEEERELLQELIQHFQRLSRADQQFVVDLVERMERASRGRMIGDEG